LTTHVKGDAVEATVANIAAVTDTSKIRKYYKLNGLGWLDAIKDDKTKCSALDTLIVSSIALRGL
jgi:EKC/KEOPS complex subunit CGI121/TPRKB